MAVLKKELNILFYFFSFLENLTSICLNAFFRLYYFFTTTEFLAFFLCFTSAYPGPTPLTSLLI